LRHCHYDISLSAVFLESPLKPVDYHFVRPGLDLARAVIVRGGKSAEIAKQGETDFEPPPPLISGQARKGRR